MLVKRNAASPASQGIGMREADYRKNVIASGLESTMSTSPKARLAQSMVTSKKKKGALIKGQEGKAWLPGSSSLGAKSPYSFLNVRV